MIRVLFVDHETRLSGGERDLVDLISGFPSGTVDAHVAVPGEGAFAQALSDLGVTVHFVPIGSALQKVSRWELARNPLVAARHAAAALAWARALRTLARKVRPQFVHTNSMKAHLLAIPAARAVRAPHVWHVRDILEAGPLRRLFNVTASVAAARVICLSHAAAVQFEGSRVDSRVRVVHNGIRPRPVSTEIRSRTRQTFGASDFTPLIGMVGQIAQWKGQDVFVEAAAKVAASHPDARFAVVGTCLFPENEAEYERGLHAQAIEAGLADKLVWAGHVEPIDEVMAALDVLVHASRLPEPFGRVIIEAMAHGTPVVTTALGAGPELVPAAAGRVVTPGDPDALATAVTELLNDRAGVDARGDASRDRAATFTPEATAASVLDIYNELRLPRSAAPRERTTS